jgi:hypothetical protein
MVDKTLLQKARHNAAYLSTVFKTKSSAGSADKGP